MAQTIGQAMGPFRAELAATKAQLAEEQRQRQSLEHNTATAFQAQIPRAQELEKQLARLKANGGRVGGMDLLNMTDVKPEVFTSKEGEPWKPWAKRIKLYLNAKASGFRAALIAAEKMTTEIPRGSLAFTDWALRDLSLIHI